MHEVTRILSAIEQGNPHAAEQLLPFVYQELRRLAAEMMAQEKPGHPCVSTGFECYRLAPGSQGKARWYLQLPTGRLEWTTPSPQQQGASHARGDPNPLGN